MTQLESDSHSLSPRKPRIKKSRARGTILPPNGEPEAQSVSVPFLHTHSKATGEMGLDTEATQGPILRSCHCSTPPKHLKRRGGLPSSFLPLGPPGDSSPLLSIHCKHFVEGMAVDDLGLTWEIFLWALPILWRASNPGERGTRSVARNRSLAWPKRTRGPAPLPSAPAMMARLLP